MDRRAKELIQKQVAVLSSWRGAAQSEVAGKAKGSSRGGRLPAMVRLRRTRSDHCIAAICHGLGHEKFQLTRLVATKSQPAQVVALDPETRPAESSGKPFHFHQRGRKKS